ncbi:flagellar type III secretion system protein FlhB [Paracoccus sp. (in: a-proteobacteria)]|uniref:flagellar type III secretion system protein FlhB n=1 Tax=Paracoccus sp. TaxID=267 RepID=UPI0026E03474|nr:flagellar type III secretion system protein FlhB [Paracoccus sp. (in: a-proteobacteria)]MDO5648398.1 flagellar type III secretion system protein FlhB [Paracoccus sp. (in: a-proteobacteria)]
MSEDKDDKQFEASEQKLRRAREKGDIPRSTELNVVMMYLGAWLALMVGAGFAVKQWLSMAGRALGAGGWQPGGTGVLAASLGQYAAVAVVVLMLVPGVAILLGLVGQRALIFSPQKLAPDFNRLNPFKNAKQKFGTQGLVQFAINTGKASFVCIGGWLMFRSFTDRLAASAMTDGAWITGLSVLMGQVLAMGIGISILFTVPDMAWKWFDHRRKNRMSRKEMQDEHKDSEGDPHMKAARRQKAVDLAMKQMLNDVADADVIIVNPTHYAVALKWQRGSGRAPVCVAKGVDDIAARIRERANKHDVPIWSDPPCARAIFATVKIGDEIQRDHFGPVAAAIRFAEQMRAKARNGW